MAWTLQQIVSVLGTVGVTSAAISALIIFMTKTWLSERIKGEIKHEYDTQIETLKARLKSESDVEIEKLKAQLKSGADVEIEKLKSQLSIAASKHQVRFSRLHETRAEVLAEVYAALKEFVRALANYVKIFEPAGDTPKPERAKIVVETGNAFIKLYQQKKIFIPKVAANKLDAITKELREAHIEFAYGVDMNKSHESTQKWIEIYEKVENLSNNAVAELEDDFRKILGDEG